VEAHSCDALGARATAVASRPCQRRLSLSLVAIRVTFRPYLHWHQFIGSRRTTMTSAGRNAKKPHVCLRSSTRPSAKQGDSSAMKSRINCPFTVSFGRNRQMLLASSRRCVIALGCSLHTCPSMPLRQTVRTPPTSCFFAPRLKDPTQPFRKRRVRSNDAHVRRAFPVLAKKERSRIRLRHVSQKRRLSPTVAFWRTDIH
jgi:hypothetical protein